VSRAEQPDEVGRQSTRPGARRPSGAGLASLRRAVLRGTPTAA